MTIRANSDGTTTNTGNATSVQPGGNVEDKGDTASASAERNEDGSIKKVEATKTEEAPKTETKTEEASKTEETPEAAAEKAKAEAKQRNDTLNGWIAEAHKDGKLSDASRKAAAEAYGVSEEVVDKYVADVLAGEQAPPEAISPEVSKLVKGVTDSFGGVENYQRFQEWAFNGGVSEAEYNAYNEALDKSPAAALVMAKAFAEKFKADGSANPPRDITTNAQGASSGAVQPFASREEQNKAIRDPRYSRDPVYRKEVERRIALTTF